jgi:hypothetical protein
MTELFLRETYPFLQQENHKIVFKLMPRSFSSGMTSIEHCFLIVGFQSFGLLTYKSKILKSSYFRDVVTGLDAQFDT